MVIRGESFAHHHEGVPGASLLSLLHEVDANVPHGRTYPLCLMSDDRVNILRGNDSHSCPNHMLQQWLAPNFM